MQKRLDEITGRDVRIWRDARKMGPGGVLESAVMTAAENSALFLMVFSPNWCASDWCPREHALFQTTGKQAVANRSRVVTAQRYPVEQYPAGVYETLLSRFFVRRPDGTPEHLFVNDKLSPGDLFEEPFGLLAGNLAETLRELERNPIRRPGRHEGAVWFAPVVAATLTDKLESLKSQAIQSGFEVTPDRAAAKLEVRLVGPGEAREDLGEPRPRLAYVDPEAKEEGLDAQLTREQAGRDGLEVLTNWTEFQERLTLRLKRREGKETFVPARQGASIYFLHDAPDGARAQELSGHLSAAGCAVQPQWAASTRERAQQNKLWMDRSDGILVLLGKCSSDWASIQLRNLVQFGAKAKHKSLYLDDPESAAKNMLKGRPDLQVLDGLGGHGCAAVDPPVS